MRQRLTALVAVLLIISASGPAVAATNATAGTAGQESNAQCDYPLTMTDARGEQVTIESEPASVVTLYPGDAQLAYSIGAEDKVVGMPVSEYTESLDASDRTDITGDDGVTPIAEEIVALDPDVVLAGNIALSNQDLLETLEDAGITVVVLDTATSLDDVRENVRVTGEVTGECASATETIDWMDERLETYATALEGEDTPLAYYAGGEDGATHGSETFQHDVMTAAGLENLAAEAGETGWVQLDSEVVVDEDPEWIVYPDRTDAPPMADQFAATTAIEAGNTVAVDDNAMSQPGPNVVYAIETLIEQIHPDAYDEIESDLTAIDEEYGKNTAPDDSDDQRTESAIPGFGVPVALVAVLAAAGFIARRR